MKAKARELTKVVKQIVENVVPDLKYNRIFSENRQYGRRIKFWGCIISNEQLDKLNSDLNKQNAKAYQIERKRWRPASLVIEMTI